MKLLKSIILLPLLLLIILSSCNTSKRAYNQGLKLEQQGMISEAATFYYNALQRDRENIEASIRLKNVAEIILDEKLDNFQAELNEGNSKRAIHEFILADQFKNKLRQVNVNIRIPEERYFHYNELKKSYIEKEIDKLHKLISEEKFIEAKLTITNLKKIEPNNQEIRDLEGFVLAEPVYREAMSLYEAEKFKNAYYMFDKVLNFKNSSDMKDLSQQKASYYLLIRSIRNATDFFDVDEKLKIKLEASLVNNKDPFLNVFSSEKYKRLLTEKELSESNKWSESATELFFTDVAVDVVLTDINVSGGNIKEKKLRGWQRYKKKMINEEGKEYYKDAYRKVYFFEYEREKNVNINAVLQIRDFETNKVILSKELSVKQSDRVDYYEFEGNHEDLRTGYWSSRDEDSTNDRIDLSNAAISNVREKLKGRKNIKSTETIEDEAVSALSDKIVVEILKYNKNIQNN